MSWLDDEERSHEWTEKHRAVIRDNDQIDSRKGDENGAGVGEWTVAGQAGRGAGVVEREVELKQSIHRQT